MLGTDIHLIIEHNNPNDVFGWVGVFCTGHHDFRSSLRDRDYQFFGRIAGVRGNGPKPNGVPSDASITTKREILRFGAYAHSFGHMPLREFIKRKLLCDSTVAEATVVKLRGDDPVEEYFLKHFGGPDVITLDDNTRVVFFFDN